MVLSIFFWDIVEMSRGTSLHIFCEFFLKSAIKPLFESVFFGGIFPLDVTFLAQVPTILSEGPLEGA